MSTMAATANFSVSDAETTPITHTFVTNGTIVQGSERISTWRNTSQGRPLGQEEVVTAYARRKANQAYTQKVSMTIPIVANVNGVSTVIRSLRAYYVLEADPGSTEQERKNLRSMLFNIPGSSLQHRDSYDKAEGYSS